MWYFALFMWFIGMVLVSFTILHGNTYKEKSPFGDKNGWADNNLEGLSLVYWLFSPISIPLTVLGFIVYFITKLLFIPFKPKPEEPKN